MAKLTTHISKRCLNFYHSHTLTTWMSLILIFLFAATYYYQLNDNYIAKYLYEDGNNFDSKKITLTQLKDERKFITKNMVQTDLIGLFFGVITFVLSLYITQKIDVDSKKEVKEVKDLAQKIDRSLTKIQVIEGYENIFKKLSEIIRQGDKNQNINIMNHTASFGYYLTFNYDILREFSYRKNKTADLSNLTMTQVHLLYEDVHSIYNNLFTQLTYLGNTMEDRIKYITLCPDSISGVGSSDTEFAEYYLKDILADTKILCFENDKDKKISEDPIFQEFISEYENNRKKNKKNQLLLFPKIANSDIDISSVTTFFLNEQRKKIEALKGHKIEVKLFSKGIVPIQIFLTTADIDYDDYHTPENSTKSKCLIFYINNQTIGKVSSLKAFYTEDREIVDYFNTIFHSNYQKAKPS